MNCRIRIGLLPLYIKLYDDIWPGLRTRLDAFLFKISEEFDKRGIGIIKVPVCRLKEEFDLAIRTFEKENADAIVTLHLAYSPSLESSEALGATKLPIVVLDTTETYDFSPGQSENEILYNHGIHGVQDMCSLLARNGKDFCIEAGHWQMSDVFDRIAARLAGIKIASNLRKSRVGIIGEPFKGMGDFRVPSEDLKRDIGIVTVRFGPDRSEALLRGISEKEIIDEIADDLSAFEAPEAPKSNSDFKAAGSGTAFRVAHREAATAGLLIRKWIASEKLTAVTVNFMDIGSKSGLGCMPFLEISKAMAEGTGYAGEGDILTAALTGALMQVYGEVSFTEMFCPDWKNNSILLSHMGEMNLALMADKPVLLMKAFPFSDASDTVAVYGRFKEGDAVIVNLVPGGRGKDTICTAEMGEAGEVQEVRRSYTLIIAGGKMEGAQEGDNMKNSIRGWFRPDMPVASFLEEFSYAGGTHHSALIYCGSTGVPGVKKALATFARLMGWQFIDIC